jgi:hypothetical protein
MTLFENLKLPPPERARKLERCPHLAAAPPFPRTSQEGRNLLARESHRGVGVRARIKTICKLNGRL